VGKDADFVVLSGEPFATHTRVQAVYVNGLPAFTAKAERKATVLRAGRVYTGTGEVIPGGAVLVEEGTIRAVGRDVSAPPDAVLRRYDRAVVVPGFLDLATGLGVGGALNTPVALTTKLGERLVAGDAAVAVARQGGVTTVLLASTNAAPGPVVAFKLGDRPRVVQDPVAIHFSVSGNLTSQANSLRTTLQGARAYADSWTKYEAALADYEKKKKDYDEYKAKQPKPEEKKADTPPRKDEEKKSESTAKKDDGGKPEEKKSDTPPKKEEPKPDTSKKEELKAPEAPEKPRVVETMEPYRALFAAKIPALVEAHRTDAMKLAIQIFRDEFNLRTVLLGADDAFRVGDLLAQKQVAVAVGPEIVRTVERDPINLAQVLANRGVPFGYQSKATTGVKTLPLAVQYAVRQGLGIDDALAGLTGSPAKFLSVDKTIGTLAAGKDADLVVLSGPPFELSSRVLAVMIDGQWVYQEEDDR
jgi:imidazolonepropionase-like amidohydrolase